MTENITNPNENDGLVQHIYNLLKQNEIIQRYNDKFDIDLLEQLSFCNRLQKFSWGKLFKVIYEASSDSEEPIKDSILLALEMFGLAIRIFDDVIDSDGPLKGSLRSETCQILSMELLIQSFYLLSDNDIIPFDTLQQALSSQFYDHYYQERNIITTVDDYFDKIIGKSTFVFIFYFSLLYPDNNDWRKIASNIGTVSQIKNDLYDIFSDNAIEWKHNSLPYILLNSITNNNSLDSIKATENLLEKSENKLLQQIFFESGAFDFCIQIIDEEKQQFEKHLKTMLSKEQRVPFITYLERIRFFDF
ncbi:hypothetical protein A5886_001211 [Enterococcus sp. 8G7_MSG3316]|uniref:Uncharacterized protein n=1 Tax=Candidatus Enterococcus testudinis TaxID=1834191 RepID=A0A242A533_9ENTE|nr:class 1 isoprenoid biosynthesis enzyme [Enterococcus sp. 8G7_MSG3316]OTN76134.1 hypothetical protein A5886_001211 [Enterococcus sp. 8G7_MSG3316]